MANVQLARNLKTLRLKYNYTQKDLSAILNITRQAYSHYEKALREPDLCTLVRFSHFYKVTLDDLVAGIIHVDQINESLPIYNYHLGETEDHKRSIFLTDQELELIEMILSILVYTFFSRMFDLMLPPVAKHSIVVA